MNFRFLTFCVLLSIFSQAQEIKIEVLRKEAAASYAKNVFELCKKVYHEYPYLYLEIEGDGCKEYFRDLVDVQDSFFCIAFDGDKPVGVATGTPCGLHEVRRAFKGQEQQLEGMYYLGELVLLPDYRNQGIGRALIERFEETVREMGTYSKISLCQIEDVRYISQKSEKYRPNDEFWKKFGFKHHPEIGFEVFWKNVGNEGDSPHWLVFWVKSLEMK